MATGSIQAMLLALEQTDRITPDVV